MLDETTNRVETVDAKGKPVKERITSVQAARELYRRFKEADLASAKRRARLKGLIDGNPPYDQARLEELGLGNITNVNFLECRAILDQKAAASFELLFEVPTLVEVKQVKGIDPQQPAPAYGQVIAEEFTKLLFDWPGFLTNMDKAHREAEAFDLGVMIWRDEWDWRPKAFSRGSFLFEVDAEVDIDAHEAFCLRDKFRAGELYTQALENVKISEEEGWNPKAVAKLLAKIYNAGLSQGDDSDKFQTSEVESIQQRVRNADWYVEVQELTKVKVVHLCIKEVDTSEISHYIFPEEVFQSDDKNPNPAPEEFLFKKTNRYRSMGQCLWMFPYNYGDGYLKSVRGLAASIEPHCDLSNRYLGRIYDAGFLTASLLLQPEDATDLSQLQLIRMGMLTIVPPRLKTIQTSFQPQIGPLVQLRDLSVSIMRNNTGVWRQHPEVFAQNGPEKTAAQVHDEASKEARMEKPNIAFEYAQIQVLYREMYRRATNQAYIAGGAAYPGQKEARVFIERCLARGVPAELLFDPGAFDVYSTYAIGMGSWGVKLDMTNQVLSIRGLLDEQGQKNALRDWLAVRVGYRNVDRYASLVNRDAIPSNEGSIAMLENNDMAEGAPVEVGSDQIHAIHIYKHAPIVSEVVNAVLESQGQGLDIMKALTILSMQIPHIEQHLKYLSADPKRGELVNRVMPILKSGAEVLQYLTKLKERQDKAAAEQQQAQNQMLQDAAQMLQDRDSQLKLAEIEKKYQVEMAKQKSLNDMRLAKTIEQMQIKRAGAAADVGLKERRQEAELAIDSRRADADIAIKQAKASS